MEWNSIWLWEASGKMCSEMNRYYIFESSPLQHFSRFHAEQCDVVFYEKAQEKIKQSHG